MNEDVTLREAHVSFQGEHIVKRVVPLAELYDTLQSKSLTIHTSGKLTCSEYASDGFAIDALVASVAEGMRLAGKFKNKL